jgi:hypothetical protein
LDSEQAPEKETELAFIDGRDALAAVIVKPNSTGDGVLIDAYANGISKTQAARVLRHVASKEAARNAN